MLKRIWSPFKQFVSGRACLSAISTSCTKFQFSLGYKTECVCEAGAIKSPWASEILQLCNISFRMTVADLYGAKRGAAISFQKLSQGSAYISESAGPLCRSRFNSRNFRVLKFFSRDDKYALGNFLDKWQNKKENERFRVNSQVQLNRTSPVVASVRFTKKWRVFFLFSYIWKTSKWSETVRNELQICMIILWVLTWDYLGSHCTRTYFVVELTVHKRCRGNIWDGSRFFLLFFICCLFLFIHLLPSVWWVH